MKINKLSVLFLLAFTVLLMSCFNMPNISRMKQQSKLMQKLMASPDLPIWQDNREQVVQSFGDRVIEQSFDRVFDSIVTALGTLELSVQNMERESGYIVANGNPIPTGKKMELQKKELKEYCHFHGYDPSIVETRKNDIMEPAMGRMQTKMMEALSFALVKQQKKSTKVKIRASNILYPPALEEVYKIIWREIDKQIFLDTNLD